MATMALLCPHWSSKRNDLEMAVESNDQGHKDLGSLITAVKNLMFAVSSHLRDLDLSLHTSIPWSTKRCQRSLPHSSLSEGKSSDKLGTASGTS